MAVETGQKEFVGHTYSQQVQQAAVQAEDAGQGVPTKFPQNSTATLLETKTGTYGRTCLTYLDGQCQRQRGRSRLPQVLTQQWEGRSGWARRSGVGKAAHALIQLVLTPLLCLAFLARAGARLLLRDSGHRVLATLDSCRLFTSLDSPINRCISHLSSLGVIMWLIIVAVFRPISRCHNRWDEYQGLYPARVGLIVMIVACVFKEIEDFSTVRSFKIFFKFDFWRIYRTINHWSVIIAMAMKIQLEFRVHHRATAHQASKELHNKTASNAHEDILKDFEGEQKLTDAMFAVATTISIMHFLYWIQLHKTMGPIVISISKVFSDVVTISCMYLVVLLAFSCGIVFLSSDKISRDECKYKLTQKSFRLGPRQNAQSESVMHNFQRTIEMMFWSLLGPGQEFKGDMDNIIGKQVQSLPSPFK
jgi:hypothetical protein